MRQLAIGIKPLIVPAMVPSISSFETQLQPVDALYIQHHLREPISLVSAFDLRLQDDDFSDACKQFKAASILMLDSGGYEASRIRKYAKQASPEWDFDLYKAISNNAQCDLVFSFDYFIGDEEPIADFEYRLVAELLDHHKFLSKEQLVPVVHLQSETGDRRLNDEEAVILISRVASELGSLLVAVPERELGPGLIAKTKKVRSILSAIGQKESAPGLHILGCGNLLSFAFLAAAGAMTFDGLEWCRTCVASDFHLHHFQHLDLFGAPKDYTENPATDWLFDLDLPYSAKLAIRNLKALQSFSGELQARSLKNEIPQMVREYYGEQASLALLKALG